MWWHLPYNGDDDEADARLLVGGVQVKETLALLVLPQLLYKEQKYSIEKLDKQNEHIAVVSCFVHSNCKEKSLQEQGHRKKCK